MFPPPLLLKINNKRLVEPQDIDIYEFINDITDADYYFMELVTMTTLVLNDTNKWFPQPSCLLQYCVHSVSRVEMKCVDYTVPIEKTNCTWK